MFEWSELLVLAERLVDGDDSEAVRRTAINRAYYAAYHAAARFVRARGLLATKHSHRAVWSVLARSEDRTVASIGARGDLLRQRRQEADYVVPFPGDAGRQAREGIAEARAIIEALDELSS